MLEYFQPAARASSIDRIPVEQLAREGIKGLLIDLDNTMTLWNDVEVSPQVTEWVLRVKSAGIGICVVSNNSRRQRVAIVAERLDVPFVYGAVKPRRRAFRTGMEILGTGSRDTAVIGDQLFTDILGGNRLGLYTILVTPISTREHLGTRLFMRNFERLFFWLMKRFAPAKPCSSKMH